MPLPISRQGNKNSVLIMKGCVHNRRDFCLQPVGFELRTFKSAGQSSNDWAIWDPWQKKQKMASHTFETLKQFPFLRLTKSIHALFWLCAYSRLIYVLISLRIWSIEKEFYFHEFSSHGRLGIFSLWTVCRMNYMQIPLILYHRLLYVFSDLT